MKKNMNKTVSLILVLMMLFGLVTSPIGVYAVSVSSATVGNVDLVGTVNNALPGEVDVVITLVDDTLAAEIANSADLSGWFENLPAGLTAQSKDIYSQGASSVTIVVNGTPTEAVSAPMVLTIPNEALAISAVDLAVTTNIDAKFRIFSSDYVFDISTGDITIITGDDPETQIKVIHGVDSITTGNLDKTKEVIIIGSTTANTIIANNVAGVKVTLNGVSIDANTLGKSPFLLQGTSTVELTLLGTNSLVAATNSATSANFAGIQVNTGNILIITDASTGSLTARGGANSAGIGGGGNGANGTVIIDGGSIIALAGSYGAGIGGGYGALGAGGTITINGGTVLAKANIEGPGIGDGYGYNHGGTGGSIITINGGTITAIGGSCAGAGIGGSCGGVASAISIASAAVVKAASTSASKAIEAINATLAEGSTANVLMANYTNSKATGILTELVNSATGSTVSNFAPEKNGSYRSIAFTVNDNTTYNLKTNSVYQQHSSPASSEFEMELGSRLKQFNVVTDLTFSLISPTTASFNKKIDEQTDRTIELALNGNTLTAIKNGDEILAVDVDYTTVGSTVTLKKEYLALQPVGTTTLIFEFSAGPDQILAITLSDTTPAPTPEPAPIDVTSGGGQVTPPTKQDTVLIIVNGEKKDAGTERKTTEEGKTIATIEVNNQVIEGKIKEIIKSNSTGGNNLIIISVKDTTSYGVKVELTGDMIKLLEENNFNLSVQRDNVAYLIPAEEFSISNIAKGLEVEEDSLKDIKIEIKITRLDESIVAKLKEAVKASDAELVIPPVQFEITARTMKTDGTEEVVSIRKFSNYVERVIEIPAGLDPNKITTGIVFNLDGTYSHVPTSVYYKDGKWYASINSLTNSTYSVIWSPITVKSVENHWSKDMVNDMASRLIIKDSESFMPDQMITRGDFAEYITKAIGVFRLREVNAQKFSDVDVTHELAYAIEVASEYGIITGYPDGSFKPDTQISREEAMVMYSRTMAIVGLDDVDGDRINHYTDKDLVTSWAYNDVKKTVGAGVFNGRTGKTLNPKDTFTYAEAATAIRNLLVATGLINE